MAANRKNFGSLRLRITLAMLALALVGSSIFAFSVFVAAERLEQSVLNRHIKAEFDSFAVQTLVEPEIKASRSALLLGFVGRDNPDLPKEFLNLPAGSYHAVPVDDRDYQVYVGEEHGRQLYVAYDITEWEALEKPVINILVIGVLVGALLAIVLGFWASSQVIAPVTALAQRLQSLDPRERDVRISEEFGGKEVAAIAESFDRYLRRVDGFVEREQLFTKAAAHELRTPLAVIQGATEVLADTPELPGAAQRATGRLQRATRDMREFIEALMILSREDQHEDFDQARSELSRIVRQLVEDFARSLEGKPIDLHVSSIHELWINAPPALPMIVISNILRNAIEHTRAGSIEIELRGRTLTVKDSGAGIAEDAQHHIFDSDYSTKPGGGLGLHLTKRICDRFAWQVSIESALGHGTSVSVTF
jgi:signal transduction histidine kinase